MSRQQSGDQRQAAFVKLAAELHTQLENWYDAIPLPVWTRSNRQPGGCGRNLWGKG